MSLIDKCLCGAREFSLMARNTLPIAVCACGVEHLDTPITRKEYELQYRGAYHRAVDRHPGCIPYRERYDHDRQVAAARWKRYGEVLGARLTEIRTALDVGAANGAFVDQVKSLGIEAMGIDPDPGMARPGVTTAIAADLEGAWHFDLVTYHDVLEHVVDPHTELFYAARLVEKRGFIIVDVPDVSTEAGHHHYKTEHPWYFTDGALERLLTDAGFRVYAIDRPLPGKMVAYGVRT